MTVSPHPAIEVVCTKIPACDRRRWSLPIVKAGALSIPDGFLELPTDVSILYAAGPGESTPLMKPGMSGLPKGGLPGVFFRGETDDLKDDRREDDRMCLVLGEPPVLLVPGGDASKGPRSPPAHSTPPPRGLPWLDGREPGCLRASTVSARCGKSELIPSIPIPNTGMWVTSALLLPKVSAPIEKDGEEVKPCGRALPTTPASSYAPGPGMFGSGLVSPSLASCPDHSVLTCRVCDVGVDLTKSSMMVSGFPSLPGR
mmetsp:Transcript_1076/g.1800  ORF Transcript_1076/g.1800 Transcript_1076/m.1800 type:complete len:257 (-) Transcript_1076:119-889(-)